MDALRARAYLDILLGTDSRPLGQGTQDTCEPQAPVPVPGGPAAGVIPPGLAGRVNLTIPAATLLDRAALYLVGDIGAVVVRGSRPLAERADLIPCTAPGDPNPEANTPDRYRAVAWHWSIPGSPSIRSPSSEY